MKTKIIISLTIIALISIFFLTKKEEPIDFDEQMESISFEDSIFSEINLRASSLGDASIPNIDLGMDIDFDVIELDVSGIEQISSVSSPSVSFDHSIFDISFPEINIASFPQQSPGQQPGTQQQESHQAPSSGGGWTATQENCALFSFAPSCSFVPEENRSMCEQCKNAGF